MPYQRDASPRKLTDLPVELITELYLVALSPALPQTCRYIYFTIRSLPPSFHARYIFGRHPPEIYLPHPEDRPAYVTGAFLTRALRYPICTIRVLEAMLHLISCTPIPNSGPKRGVFELPKRLFRSLGGSSAALDANSEPLPLLRYLWKERPDFDFVKPMSSSHDGYPLARAVHARFIPLIRFLLDHGADPGKRKCMAVRVAIGKRDLALVKMLIEFEPEPETLTKKRRRMDRVAMMPPLLNLAVRCNARDIVRYLVEEKGYIPDMKTLTAI